MLHHETPNHSAWYVVTSSPNGFPIAYATTRHPFQVRRWLDHWNIADMRQDGARVSVEEYGSAELAMRAANALGEALNEH